MSYVPSGKAHPSWEIDAILSDAAHKVMALDAQSLPRTEISTPPPPYVPAQEMNHELQETRLEPLFSWYGSSSALKMTFG